MAMDYNKRLLNLTEKYRQFFSDPTPGQILALICPYTFDIDYSPFNLPDRPLSAWDFNTEAREFALMCKRRHDAWLSVTRDLDNDYFPALSVNLGYGVHSAYFSGQPVHFGVDTSWTEPCIHDWEDMARLKLDENNPWYQKILEITRYFVQWQDGDYAVSGFANAAPGDMANALRGNDIFLDLYDEPEKVDELMQLCVEPVVRLENAIRSITGDVNGGSVTANCWFPGRVPYMSGDFNDLCSPDVFREHDFHTMQQIIDQFDGAFIHHHMKGFHIHGDIARLKGLKLLEISWDPNLPQPIEHLEELYEMNNGVPLMTRCHARDLERIIDKMHAGRTVLMLNVDTLEEARDAMKLIRRHSRI
ncbi:MAG: uroporphyrinogen decarboxylase family protein [Aristaeellaceae bacterium]